MIAKSLMKNPILMVGILLMSIFLFQLRDQGFFKKRASSMLPTSCKAVKVRLDKYFHKTWKIECLENNLSLEIPVDEKVVSHKLTDTKILRAQMYKALANSYISVSKYAPQESLERTMIISVRLVHPNMTLNSISEGKHVYNLKNMKNFKNISAHIKQTIQVQELTKK